MPLQGLRERTSEPLSVTAHSSNPAPYSWRISYYLSRKWRQWLESAVDWSHLLFPITRLPEPKRLNLCYRHSPQRAVSGLHEHGGEAEEEEAEEEGKTIVVSCAHT